MAQQQEQKNPTESDSSRERREESDRAEETETIHRTVRSDIASTWWPANP